MVSIPAPAYDLTIDPVAAENIGLKLRHLENDFSGEPDRVAFAGSHGEVETVDDYIVVTTIADIVPETGLTVDDLYQCDDREQLLSVIFQEYLSSVQLRDLFQLLDISDASYSFEMPVSDSMAPAPIDDGESFPKEPMKYRTETFDRERQLAKAVIGDIRRPVPSFADICRDFAMVITESILAELPDFVPTQYDDRDHPVYEMISDLNRNGYYPDTAIVGDRVLENSEISSQFKHNHDVDVFEDQWIGSHQIIIADRDYLGYAGVWAEPTIETGADLETDVDDPFLPIQVNCSQSKNWIVLEDEAVERTMI